jgi:hypothetical protein
MNDAATPAAADWLLPEQSTDFLVLVVIGAAVLAGALGDLVDTKHGRRCE